MRDIGKTLEFYEFRNGHFEHREQDDRADQQATRYPIASRYVGGRAGRKEFLSQGSYDLAKRAGLGDLVPLLQHTRCSRCYEVDSRTTTRGCPISPLGMRPPAEYRASLELTPPSA